MRSSKVIENVEITGISADGKSVGRADNLVIFISGATPGDLVDVQITGKKKKFLEGRTVKVHRASVDRTEPFCSHFGICGGCKWQHMAYEAQLRHKQQQVTDNLTKLTTIEMPLVSKILGSEKQTFYRNKLEFTFSNNRWLTKEEIDSGKEFERNALGFHIPKRFDKILDIDKCWLQSDISNDIRNGLKDFARANEMSFFDIRKQHGLLRNLIIRNSILDDVMVLVQFFDRDQKAIDLVMAYLSDNFPKITALHYVINQKGNESIYDQEVITYAGEDYMTEEMEGLKFKVGPKSFYQTNSNQAYELYKVARDFASLTGDEIVYDLYTGTGTIANFIAKDAKKVVGVESVPEAIEDAKMNSTLNNIQNCTFYAGDMKDVLNDDFVNVNGHPDVIIVDPPRAGMHQQVVESIARIKPDKLIYVSCNPATQARDIELLKESFEVIKIQPVDMFPQTQHVENVILLKSK
ncbi:MAG: 23S rRNA (uracil1939-C5)-methyltransferase [Cyclobacteriaceae bacterium]|jgi:23S rRNA (uracil1939-C5)-methyltransferase